MSAIASKATLKALKILLAQSRRDAKEKLLFFVGAPDSRFVIRTSNKYSGAAVRMNYSAYPYASPLRGLREKHFQYVFSHQQFLVFIFAISAA